jgi:two-component system, OmpR family, sensor histidine kinase TctE
VNQLLALARAESSGKTIVRQPCNLAAMTMEVMQDSLPRAMERRIDLGYDGADPGAAGVLLQGNPTLLKEMIRNLLDNALNYTPSSPDHPGVVTARVLADPFGGVLVLQIEDSGPGIPEAERELVFQPFYRTLGTNVDGSGLGLPIVREIATQHHAQITLEVAHPGQVPPGLRVSVRFQVEAQEEARAAETAQAAL